MAITFEPATLDSPFGDGEARLALREGRLFAILARLGDLHGELAGRWFVEAVFGDHALRTGETYPSLGDFEACAADTIGGEAR